MKSNISRVLSVLTSPSALGKESSDDVKYRQQLGNRVAEMSSLYPQAATLDALLSSIKEAAALRANADQVVAEHRDEQTHEIMRLSVENALLRQTLHSVARKGGTQ
jgi:hypothetical protein